MTLHTQVLPFKFVSQSGEADDVEEITAASASETTPSDNSSDDSTDAANLAARFSLSGALFLLRGSLCVFWMTPGHSCAFQIMQLGNLRRMETVF